MIKIIDDPRVRYYELTFLLPVGSTGVELKKFKDSILELLQKHQMTVEGQEDWGKKELAYSIKFKSKWENEAYYHHWLIKGSASKVADLDRDLKLSGVLIRYLVVQVVSKEASFDSSKSESIEDNQDKKTSTKKRVSKKVDEVVTEKEGEK